MRFGTTKVCQRPVKVLALCGVALNLAPPQRLDARLVSGTERGCAGRAFGQAAAISGPPTSVSALVIGGKPRRVGFRPRPSHSGSALIKSGRGLGPHGIALLEVPILPQPLQVSITRVSNTRLIRFVYLEPLVQPEEPRWIIPVQTAGVGKAALCTAMAVIQASWGRTPPNRNKRARA